MIKCHLSTFLGIKRLKVQDLVRDLDINRGTLDRLYLDKAQRVDLEVVEALCKYFDCQVGEMFTLEEES